MANLQPITHRGRIVAIVIAGRAIIDDTLAVDEHRHVQAMCLYALEIADRERPGPYTDAAAERYADLAAAGTERACEEQQ
jgi:hypothetical protein